MSLNYLSAAGKKPIYLYKDLVKVGVNCTPVDRNLYGMGFGEATVYLKNRTSPLTDAWYDGAGLALKNVNSSYVSSDEQVVLKDYSQHISYNESTGNLTFLA